MIGAVAHGQLVRENKIEKTTGKRVIRTEIIALTKGFIYCFVSSDKEKYMQVRFQKHGHFNVSEGDTLILNLVDGSALKAVAVRGGQGQVPFRPKSPGVLSLWTLFKIGQQDFSKMTSSMVTSAYVKPNGATVSNDEPLIFTKIKKEPARLLNERAKALLMEENKL